LLIDWGKVVTDLSTGRVLAAGMDLRQLDALVIKKIGKAYSPEMLDRLEVLKYLADGGVQVYSKPASIMRLLDRLSCTLTLARAGIPMPQTSVTEDVEEALGVVQRYGTAVFKPLFSTKARGMELLSKDDPRLVDRLREIRDAGNPVLYLQKKIEMPDRDLSLVFVGGEHVGTYARVRKQGSWNTTTHAGGHYAAHEASPEIVELAHRAQGLFDMALTSVDVVETEAGPVVFEVSAFGGFRGLLESTKVDAGALFADHVLREVKRA
jgi:ribosomal protein S6--L-glutamate ligase